MSEQQQDGVGKALRAHFAQDAARLPADTVDKVMDKVQREQLRASRTKWVVLSVALAACVGLVVGFGPKHGWQQQSRAIDGQPAKSAPAFELGLQDEGAEMPAGADHRQGASEWDEESLLRMTALNSLVGDDDDEAVDDDGDDDDDEASSSPSDTHAEGTWESEAQ
ncbi:MAG: hypothetical protein HY898_02600 [Deltaproteobacteria bacterium]|nr:hypothetical protein [Deltaproteobacteria bacterium]